MNKESEFLELFRKLEKHLRIEYSRGTYSYSNFMNTIHRIKKTNKNSVISNKHNFDILHQASQIRNILSHNNNVLIPSDKFLNEFRAIVKKICDPLKVGHIMIKLDDLKSASLNTPVGDIINMLKEYGYNTIPIIDNHQLMGVFTEKSAYDYLSMYKTKSLSKNMLIKDILEAIDLNSDPRKYFDFIGRNASIQDAYDLFNKDLKSRRELLLLLVTEKGEYDQALLGIVALRDIENALFN